MKRINYVSSLMSFQERVLTQGAIKKNQHTLEELESDLFFNSIFISNMDEMFEKHDYSHIINRYSEAIKIYINNIKGIISKLMEINPRININKKNSFERRFEAECRLAGNISHEYIRDKENFTFKSGELYYVTITDDDIIISHIDNRLNVYKSPMKCIGKEKIEYWKTDKLICDYLDMIFDSDNTTAIKITTHRKNSNIITKIEYNRIGFIDSTNIDSFKKVINNKTILVYNPYIYIEDLKQIIKEAINEEDEEQKSHFIPGGVLLGKDKLIEYPTDSFYDYLNFLKSVILNPDTMSIHLTIYRIGDNPALFYLLRDAINRDIKVHVNIELNASGEHINLIWKKEMEKIGIKVTTYGIGSVKVHSKLTLVKFNNGKSLVQVGTGNYHYKTTSQYTDLALFTSNDEIVHQAKKLFNLFKGKKGNNFSKELLVTRYNAREELYRLIMEEANKEKKGFICIKCNALDDKEIIKHLHYASIRGCRIRLIIRGVCTWIPDENTDVIIKSIIWDKLEHSRVYSFGYKNPTVYIGSLDLVTNKLDNRIETMAKVMDPDVLVDVSMYLNRYITSTNHSWRLLQDGSYIKEGK